MPTESSPCAKARVPCFGRTRVACVGTGAADLVGCGGGRGGPHLVGQPLLVCRSQVRAVIDLIDRRVEGGRLLHSAASVGAAPVSRSRKLPQRPKMAVKPNTETRLTMFRSAVPLKSRLSLSSAGGTALPTLHGFGTVCEGRPFIRGRRSRRSSSRSVYGRHTGGDGIAGGVPDGDNSALAAVLGAAPQELRVSVGEHEVGRADKGVVATERVRGRAGLRSVWPDRRSSPRRPRDCSFE